jgi:hypothetical protein
VGVISRKASADPGYRRLAADSYSTVLITNPLLSCKKNQQKLDNKYIIKHMYVVLSSNYPSLNDDMFMFIKKYPK